MLMQLPMSRNESVEVSSVLRYDACITIARAGVEISGRPWYDLMCVPRYATSSPLRRLLAAGIASPREKSLAGAGKMSAGESPTYAPERAALAARRRVGRNGKFLDHALCPDVADGDRPGDIESRVKVEAEESSGVLQERHGRQSP